MRSHPGLPARPGQRRADQALPPDAPRSPQRGSRGDRLVGASGVYRRPGPASTLRGTCASADVTMSIGLAALIAWLLTAGIGGYMLRTWVARGGLRRQRATGVGVPPAVVFGHAGAALVGLTVWISYLSSGWRPLAWIGVVLVCAAISLGICTVTLWTPYPVRPDPEAPAPAQPAQPTEPQGEDRSEERR